MGKCSGYVLNEKKKKAGEKQYAFLWFQLKKTQENKCKSML